VASRDEYVQKMKAQLDEWNAEIDAFESKLSEVGDETRKELEPYVQKARDARDIAVTKLSTLKNSSEESWESTRSEVEHVWKTFKQSVNYFKSQL